MAMARRDLLKAAVGVGLALPLLPGCMRPPASTSLLASEDLGPVDWPAFIGRQDMVWDKLPKEWQQAPYLGNGMLGLMVFQGRECAANELAIHVGRGDYYDNRPPVKGNPNTWIYRGRLPIGFFRLKSSGNIVSVDWRLDLWNAELRGRVVTSKGAYTLHALVHSLYDSFAIDATAENGEAVKLEWQPIEAYSHARSVCEAAMKRAAASKTKPDAMHVNFTSAPYEKAPPSQTVDDSEGSYCRQILFADSGELITAWKEKNTGDAVAIHGSIQFSTQLGESLGKARQILRRAEDEQGQGSYLQTHRLWWHEFYPLSFISIEDSFWEQFYWIQMYKFASATRDSGMLIDVFGPWYQPGFWPMIWTDLNAQLIYWTHLTSNRLKVGESLINQLDRYTPNLINNVHPEWRADCLNADTIFPADMKGPCGKKIPDHMVWLLHNYWLHCRFADDPVRMKNGLFPLLRRAVNAYRRYLKDHPDLKIKDGKIHTLNTWSPEYPGGTGTDITYTLSLIRWSCKTLLQLDKDFNLQDPLAGEWRDILDRLAPYATDENGLRIGRDIPFDQAHRHYSHLLAFYPLFDLSPEKDAALLRKSLEHWLKTNLDTGKNHSKAMAVTGYTCTGAASMYALLHQGDEALKYLNFLPYRNVSSTTMYSEGNPVIESPFSAATSMHDMLLQSWDGRLRILPAVPSTWKQLQFRSLRAQGGLLVSADRQDGKNVYVRIDCPGRRRRVEFKVEVEQAAFTVLAADGSSSGIKLTADADGFFTVVLEADSSLRIETGLPHHARPAIKSDAAASHIFGCNSRYDQLLKSRQPQELK
ncbi:MAG: hypothetical protein RL095_2435 [Verrucomicrobiota bacterium]|jgi:hypothetical protein